MCFLRRFSRRQVYPLTTKGRGKHRALAPVLITFDNEQRGAPHQGRDRTNGELADFSRAGCKNAADVFTVAGGNHIPVQCSDHERVTEVLLPFPVTGERVPHELPRRQETVSSGPEFDV